MQDLLLRDASFVSLSNHLHLDRFPKTILHGTSVAMYIVGQERRLVDPPSQVVAGVRTVTTNMDGRDALPRMSRPFAILDQPVLRQFPQQKLKSFIRARIRPVVQPASALADDDFQMRKLQISLNGSKRTSDITIAPGTRHHLVQLIRESTQLNPRRVLVISNKRVFQLYGADVVASLKYAKFQIFEWLMSEGERFKSFRSLEKAVEVLGNNAFERNDLVIALGGGVVGDLAGFAAAVYLRGIPFIQMPTTLLAQIDSSVGGKTGINLPVGKNMVGAFYQPPFVVIDTETLLTLPPRELVAGFCEMVKHGLIANQSLFKSTVKTLKRFATDRTVIQSAEFEALLTANCKFKASIVANDERESTARSDVKSRRILNFGHTTAHALEAITNYRVFRHGEAVGYGMLVAGEISKNLGLLPTAELESLREAVRLCGPLPKASDLDINQIIRSLKHDKKSVAGKINWVLLEGIGSPKIVDGDHVSARVLRLSLRTGLQ